MDLFDKIGDDGEYALHRLMRYIAETSVGILKYDDQDNIFYKNGCFEITFIPSSANCIEYLLNIRDESNELVRSIAGFTENWNDYNDLVELADQHRAKEITNETVNIIDTFLSDGAKAVLKIYNS